MEAFVAGTEPTRTAPPADPEAGCRRRPGVGGPRARKTRSLPESLPEPRDGARASRQSSDSEDVAGRRPLVYSRRGAFGQSRRTGEVTPCEQKLRFATDDIRLGDEDVLGAPRSSEREGAFATLRRERPVSFHEEPEVPMLGKGPGFWALTRYADVLEVSRNPEIFCSAQGGVNIIDQPPQLNEFFGSMIVMDDPRHARLRRIVSRGFTPRHAAQDRGRRRSGRRPRSSTA